MAVSWLVPYLLLLSSASYLFVASIDSHEDFLQCLSAINQTSMYTQDSESYTSVFQFSMHNHRFMNSTLTPKPAVVLTPTNEYEVQQIILCAKKTNTHVRVLSGGHDYEGLSYRSYVPFVLIALLNLRNITVDVKDKSAWVESGSTIGELYYTIANKSDTLGFPAGVCPTVGIVGHSSGGGTGTMQRKYGLAADNIVDARIVDANGRILDRMSMGEDHFWAIRGGGGNTFGLVLAWKIKLVDVPKNVTVFSVDRTLKQNATDLVHKWQYVSSNLPKDLYLRILVSRAKTNSTTIVVTFRSLFLGGIDQLLPIMQKNFPELGLTRKDTFEMSWIKSVLFIAEFPRDEPLDTLLNRAQPSRQSFKGKADYVQVPMSKKAIQGIWDFFYEDEAESSQIIMDPFGGQMDEISEHNIPFPHRAGNLFDIQYLAYWNGGGQERAQQRINWIRRLYAYMTPFVSKNPRGTYINYRDLDIGVNNMNGNTSYAKAKVWGSRYFKNNFDRLVQVKTKVDPSNLFKNEQSIPPLTS